MPGAATKQMQSAAEGFGEVLGILGKIPAAPDANPNVVEFVTDMIKAVSVFMKLPPQGQNMGQSNGQSNGQPGGQPQGPPQGPQGPPGMAPGGMPQGPPPGAMAGPGGPPPGSPGGDMGGGPGAGPSGGLPPNAPMGGRPGANGVTPISKITDTDELRRMLSSNNNV